MKKKSKNKEAQKKSKAGKEGKECNDKNCPVHGTLKVRGKTFTKKVIKSNSRRTAAIEIETRHYIPKYERYEIKRKKLQVHNPECMNAKEGDLVVVGECRPLSKTKHFVITKKVS